MKHAQRFSKMLAAMLVGVYTGVAEETQAPQAAPPEEGTNTMVILQTSKGEMTLELFAKQAPETVKNFLQYVDDKHYDGTIFHRVINGFMIQGGGFTPDMNQKPTRAAIKNEAGNGLKNEKYTLAMARTSDPDSATSQFFVNVVDNVFLNRSESKDGVGYCVFGRVVKGQDVVDAIRDVPTGRKGYMGDVPVDPVVIVSATRAAAP